MGLIASAKGGEDDIQKTFMTEKELLEQVRALAQRYNLLFYHTFDSRRSSAGFPDVVLVTPRRVIFLELKGYDKRGHLGRLTEAQKTWLNGLRRAEQEAYTLTPEHLGRLAEDLNEERERRFAQESRNGG